MTSPATSSLRHSSFITPYGAHVEGNRVSFRIWAPKVQNLDVLLRRGGQKIVVSLTKSSDGIFTGDAEATAGDLYELQLDKDLIIPDPASRFQPEGVHGPSQIVDLSFPWSDGDWKGIGPDPGVIYELHVGAFSPEGTFRGVTDRLLYLKDLGISVIELMPVADFPGNRNWGYDGVLDFAPARCYGQPRDLQELVDKAHKLGIAVILDVVYNHFGPDGNYWGCLTDDFVATKHKNLWGHALKFDGHNSKYVRDFFIQNALYWLELFHFDGLRLDATHAIIDDSGRHFLAELSDKCREKISSKPLLLIAEDHRREKKIFKPTEKGGWGFNGVWADDFHHQLRRRLTGDNEGYFQSYRGLTTDIALALKYGWSEKAEQTDQISPQNFVFCIQNHDQIGNRAFGDRIHHQIDLATYRAASTLLLFAPFLPLLFMGQEWATSSPFLFFTDHKEELGNKVIEGRRNEFKQFSQFSAAHVRNLIPSPQSEKTFNKSRLNWHEVSESKHKGIYKLYKDLIALRKTLPAIDLFDSRCYGVQAIEPSLLAVRRKVADDHCLIALINIEGAREVTLSQIDKDGCLDGHNKVQSWIQLLSTEDRRYAADSKKIEMEKDLTGETWFRFARSGAVVFKSAS